MESEENANAAAWVEEAAVVEAASADGDSILETVMEEVLTDGKTPPSKKVKKESRWNKYGRKYNKAWEEEETLRRWILPVPGDEKTATCRYCRCIIRAHHGDLLQHAKTEKHAKNTAKFAKLIGNFGTMNSCSREILDTARALIAFINSSPSPYHVVNECRRRLIDAGFDELKEKDTWYLLPKKKYFFTRNQSTLVAFAVGGNYAAGNGFTMIGTHTDSPCLRLKPVSKIEKHGYVSLGVETYGGGLWGTWFDRDLTVAGRVLTREDSGIEHRLVHIEKPIVRVPNLAIHLNRSVNDGFAINKETDLKPILATSVTAQLEKGGGFTISTDDIISRQMTSEKHSSVLLGLLAKELNIGVEHFLDFDLCLADTQPADIGGALDEFIFAPRLDNLFCTFAALQGLMSSCETPNSLEDDPHIRAIMLFDNEEVGSMSAQGAQSSLAEYFMRRVSAGGQQTSFEECISKSMLISADMAHAIHPNYPQKHEDNHQVSLHKGPVIKINNNQRYATTGVTSSIIRLLAERVEVPLQEFVTRNDMPCGTTIGPILASTLGLRVADIGCPMLSMHSIREMCCTSGVLQMILLLKAYFEHFPSIDSTVNVD